MNNRHGNILVVDDDMLNRVLVSTCLEEQGHTSEMAEDGVEALEKLAENRYDLVLLDVLMPRMDGYAVLERIKNTGGWRDLPVIMISALDEMDSVVKCIEMGAEDYLPKPFDPVLLHARVGACLEKKWLRDLEVEYLQQVDKVTAAAAAVESGAFEPASLNEVARREDALGQLARVFQRMANEVKAREQRLKNEVKELRIQIDEAKKAQQVAEITESEYFQNLQKMAGDMRRKQNEVDSK